MKIVSVKEAERLLDEVGAMGVKELYDLGKRLGYTWLKGQRRGWLQKRTREILQEEIIDHAKRKART